MAGKPLACPERKRATSFFEKQPGVFELVAIGFLGVGEALRLLEKRVAQGLASRRVAGRARSGRRQRERGVAGHGVTPWSGTTRRRSALLGPSASLLPASTPGVRPPTRRAARCRSNRGGSRAIRRPAFRRRPCLPRGPRGLGRGLPRGWTAGPEAARRGASSLRRPRASSSRVQMVRFSRGIHEVEVFKGQCTVEPGLVWSARLLDRLLRGFERFRDVRRLVEAAGAHEVGGREVALEFRVLGVLCGRRLERLHGAARVPRRGTSRPGARAPPARCRPGRARGCARRRRSLLGSARRGPASCRPSA